MRGGGLKVSDMAPHFVLVANPQEYNGRDRGHLGCNRI